MFPLDLGARGTATIGGYAATNAGGNRVIRYGMVRSMILGLEAVLADGTVLSSMNRMLKNNAGYDLKHLFIGTEGTLGVVTRLVLRLVQEPRSQDTALWALRDFVQITGFLRFMYASLGGTLPSSSPCMTRSERGANRRAAAVGRKRRNALVQSSMLPGNPGVRTAPISRA